MSRGVNRQARSCVSAKEETREETESNLKFFLTADHPSVEYGHPYRWWTNLRMLLPRFLCWLIDKGKDCESVGADHHWYNQDNEHSGCYHCKVVRVGRFWQE
jgi:hypothetical protein